MKPFERLHDFQERAVAESIGLLKQGERVLLQSPTGSGKTLMFSTAISRFNPRGRTVIMATLTRLCRQPFKYEWLAQRGGHNQWDAQVVAATPTSILANMTEILRHGPIRLVIPDECHGAVAEQAYRAIMILLAQGAWVLGVTATPDRADKQTLDSVFTKVVVALTIEEAIKRGFVAVPRVRSYKMPDGSSVLGRPDEVAIVVKSWWTETQGKEQTILFTPTVAKAVEYANYFNKHGIAAAVIHGGMSEEMQDEILSQYEAGKIVVLTNAQILTEGVDLPCTRRVVLAKEVNSRKVFSQATGRGIRIGPNGENRMTVMDFGWRESHTLIPEHDGLGNKPPFVWDEPESVKRWRQGLPYKTQRELAQELLDRLRAAMGDK